MSDSEEDEISQLLREGLDHYGYGSISEAILAWNRVLSIDPDNADARDYIRSADRRTKPRPEKSTNAQQVLDGMVVEARRLMGTGDFEAALDLLRSVVETDEFNLELEATVELVRSYLYKVYLESVGDLAVIPSLSEKSADITKFNLPPDAGFLLSMIDGATSIESLISLSGMDAFEALRIVKGLMEGGLVRIES